MRVKLWLVLAAFAMASCGSPAAPTPSISILSPKANAQLKIGETITIKWQCVACEHIKGDRGVVKLYKNGPSAGGFNEIGEIATGFLTDSRPWVVGNFVKSYGYLGPGFYYLAVHSYPPPSDTAWTEATTGFSGLLIEIVQ